jgi:uncharacterized protein (TIGR00369 family)
MREHTAKVTAALRDNMSEETMTTRLPTDLHERFTDAAAATGVDPDDLLTELVRDHVAMHESIAAYADRNRDGPRALAEHGPGHVMEVPPPVGRLVGFDMVDLGEGRSEIAFEAGPEHANPMGTLHGGILCDVGDAAMGTAVASTLAPGESFTTLELDAKYLKPVWDGHLTARGEVVKRNRRTALIECRVTDAEGSLVAKLESVCLVLSGEAASGR